MSGSEKGWYCRTCGKHHDELPRSYGADRPAGYAEAVRAGEKVTLTADTCVSPGKMWAVRGCILLPIIGQAEPFIWGAWVSLSEESYDKMMAVWDRVGREKMMEPRFGWLFTELPCYEPSTFMLKTMVHLQPTGERPLIELEPTDHPLAVEQRNGMTIERVKEIAERLGVHT